MRSTQMAYPVSATAGCGTVITRFRNIRIFCRLVCWGVFPVLIRNKRHKNNILLSAVFVSAIHGCVLCFVGFFPVVGGISTNPRHAFRVAQVALLRNIGQVSPELLHHGCEKIFMLCGVLFFLKICLALCPADGQQDVFRIFRQRCFCAAD